jgi:hypothetical protein
MDEQNLNSDDYEVAPQDTGQESQQSEEVTIDADAQKREEAKERDFKALRQRQKELEWEIKQRDQLLERLLQQQPQQKVETPVEQEDPDEDYIPAGKVKGIARKTVQPLEKKIQELEEKIARQEQQKLLSSLKSQYPDFDDVVNVETLELLEKQEPELAATIAHFKDPYKMGLQSYKYIKALGLVENLPDARRKKETLQKIERNQKTVQSPAAFDKRPMAQAYKTTQAESKRLYEEMMHYASQANGL